MSNHLSTETPPSWEWRMAPDQHAGMFFPAQGHQPLLPTDGNPRWELLFEKPLTPSDVGKLNRLVIPKQHAERHFPLDASSAEKGLLLSFEDESGRTWQFRYSYWTSSQSYVLTKGWSRFVKEKRLDAGDVVLFERREGSGGVGWRLHIGCKRRGEDAEVPDIGTSQATVQQDSARYGAAAPSLPTEGVSNPAVDLAAGSSGKAVRPSLRRLRLFGVNLDCGPEQEQAAIHDINGCSSPMDSGGRFQIIRRG